MIRYDLFDNGSLLIVRFTGIIDKSDIISFIEYIFPKTDSDSLNRILCDFREAESTFSPNEIEDIANVQALYDKGQYKVKEVFLVKNPENTMLATLYTLKFKNWILLVCSTTRYCINQFSLSINDQELENMLESLKYEFHKSNAS